MTHSSRKYRALMNAVKKPSSPSPTPIATVSCDNCDRVIEGEKNTVEIPVSKVEMEVKVLCEECHASFNAWDGGII